MMVVLKTKIAGNWTEVAGDVPFMQTLPQPYIDFVNYWTPTAWTNAILQNGYVPHGSFQRPQYRKVGDIVYCRGVATSGVIGVIFNLPAGFRPPLTLIFALDAGNVHSRVDVREDGNIYVQNGSPAASLSLDGVVFSTSV